MAFLDEREDAPTPEKEGIYYTINQLWSPVQIMNCLLYTSQFSFSGNVGITE